jgi:hypothetical protein
LIVHVGFALVLQVSMNCDFIKSIPTLIAHSFYCFAEWWYIVAFIKLTVYQIYHTLIHPLQHSL